MVARAKFRDGAVGPVAHDGAYLRAHDGAYLRAHKVCMSMTVESAPSSEWSASPTNRVGFRWRIAGRECAHASFSSFVRKIIDTDCLAKLPRMPLHDGFASDSRPAVIPLGVPLQSPSSRAPSSAYYCVYWHCAS